MYSTWSPFRICAWVEWLVQGLGMVLRQETASLRIWNLKNGAHRKGRRLVNTRDLRRRKKTRLVFGEFRRSSGQQAGKWVRTVSILEIRIRAPLRWAGLINGIKEYGMSEATDDTFPRDENAGMKGGQTMRLCLITLGLFFLLWNNYPLLFLRCRPLHFWQMLF